MKKIMTDQEKVQEILVARINELCKERDMSFYTLSYKSTIPLTTLIHIMEGNTKNPGIFTIMKICDGLGVTLQEFFDTEDFEQALIETRDEN